MEGNRNIWFEHIGC